VHANAHILLYPDVPFCLGSVWTLCLICRSRILCPWCSFPFWWISATVRCHRVLRIFWNCLTVGDEDTAIFRNVGKQPLIVTAHITYGLNAQTGRDSSVCIATRYRLDGPGMESRWGRDFPHPSRPALGPWGKAAGAWRWPPIPSSAGVKEIVVLYFYPSGLLWSVVGWALP
jgi:hypothetical protein